MNMFGSFFWNVSTSWTIKFVLDLMPLFINFGVVDFGNYVKLIEYSADSFTILYTSEVPRAFYFTLLWIPDFCNFPRIFILNIAYLPISVVLLIHTNKKALRNKDFSDEIQWLNEIYMTHWFY